MPRFSAPGLFLLLIASGICLAQDDVEEARARASGLLDRLEGYDEAVEGVFHYGIYLRGKINLGSMKVVVERAPPGNGAVYKVTSSAKMVVGAESVAVEEQALLDGALALRSLVQTETTTKGEAQVRQETKVERTEDGWVRVHSDGRGEPRGVRAKGGDIRNYPDVINLMLLVRRLDLRKTSYVVQALEWPAKPGASPAVTDVRIDMSAPAPYWHRGEKVGAFTARVKRSGRDRQTFVLDFDGYLLAFWQEGLPVVMVAGTEKQCGLDIEKNNGGGAETPEEAVVVYIRVMARLVPVDALDRVMDWEALRSVAVKLRPQLARLTPGAFAQGAKRELLRNSRKGDEGAVERIRTDLEVVISPDRHEATVSLPGRPAPMKLRKSTRGWLITEMW
ncbi:MAG: hypothetical protein ACE10D_03995 [Planctomycetota bacterium]|nr:hypothetical protein [Planctomycetota bacterium]